MKTNRPRLAWDKSLFFKVISIITDLLSGGSPAGFELDETPVFWFGPPKAETFIAILRVPFYGFPHNKVVGSKMLIFEIGSSIFIKCLFTKMEIDSPCYSFSRKEGKDNEPKIF